MGCALKAGKEPINVGLGKSGMEQRGFEGQRVYLRGRAAEMQTMRKARRDDERIAGAQMDRLRFILMCNLAATHEAYLEIIVIMALLGKRAALDQIDMIMTTGGVEALQGNELSHENPSFFMSITYFEKKVYFFGRFAIKTRKYAIYYPVAGRVK